MKKIFTLMKKDLRVLEHFLVILAGIYITADLLIFCFKPSNKLDLYILLYLSWFIPALTLTVLLPDIIIKMEERTTIYRQIRSLPVNPSQFYLSKFLGGLVLLSLFYLIPNIIIGILIAIFPTVESFSLYHGSIYFYQVIIFISLVLIYSLLLNLKFLSERIAKPLIFVIVITLSSLYMLKPFGKNLFSIPVDELFRNILIKSQTKMTLLFIVLGMCILTCSTTLVVMTQFLRKGSYKRF